MTTPDLPTNPRIPRNGDGFVPLNHESAPPDSTAFRLKVIPREAANGAFAPLSHPTAGTAGLPSCADGSSRQPTVTLRHEGDRVAGARLECSCGQVIDLDFSF
jgi:hypothetical protein